MPRAPSSGRPHVGQLSPGRTTQRSAHSSTWKSSPRLGAHVVVAVLVGAHDPLRHGLQAARRDDARGLGQADRAHGALVQAEGLHVLVGEQREAARRTRSALSSLSSWSPGMNSTTRSSRVVLARERLHGGGLGDVQERRELGDGVHARGGDLLHLPARRRRSGRARQSPASALAAQPHAQCTSSASPASASAMNSQVTLPPIWPGSASTGR